MPERFRERLTEEERPVQNDLQANTGSSVYGRRRRSAGPRPSKC